MAATAPQRLTGDAWVRVADVNGTVVVWTFTSPVAVHKTLEGIVGTAVADLSWNASSTRLAIVGDASKGCVTCTRALQAALCARGVHPRL